MRVLLVEDHQVLRQGLALCLKREFSDVTLAETGTAQAAKIILGDGWDLVLLDLGLPDSTAFGLLAYIKTTSPEAKVIVLTSSSEEDCGLLALREGADGFVMKSASFADVAEAIRQVRLGHRYFSKYMAGRVLDSVLGRNKTPALLSSKELDVVRLIARGRSGPDIAGHLHVSPKTIETYRTRICQKLGLRGYGALTRFAVLHERTGGSEIAIG